MDGGPSGAFTPPRFLLAIGFFVETLKAMRLIGVPSGIAHRARDERSASQRVFVTAPARLVPSMHLTLQVASARPGRVSNDRDAENHEQ